MGDRIQSTSIETTFSKDAEYFAQPYDLDAKGFFFLDEEDYLAKRKTCKNAFGFEVEEFEIHYYGTDDLNHALFKALHINQANILSFMEKVDDLDEHQKIILIIAVGECGYHFDIRHDDPDQFDVQIYNDTTMKELAEQFVDEGLFGDIPKSLEFYIDYDSIACDLAHDYTEITIAEENYIYRMD